MMMLMVIMIMRHGFIMPEVYKNILILTKTLLFVKIIISRDVANFKLNARKESKKVVLSSEAREALRFFES